MGPAQGPRGGVEDDETWALLARNLDVLIAFFDALALYKCSFWRRWINRCRGRLVL